MSKYNPERFQRWYAKNRERLLPIRRKYNAKYCKRPEVIAKAKIKNALPESRAVRKAYKRSKAGRRAERKYVRKPEVKLRRKNHDLMVRYGITLDQYNNVLASQGNACMICRLPKTHYHIDHDHQTGKIRGLLCNCCNQGLGLFRDNTEILSRAIEYLKQNV